MNTKKKTTKKKKYDRTKVLETHRHFSGVVLRSIYIYIYSIHSLARIRNLIYTAMESPYAFETLQWTYWLGNFPLAASSAIRISGATARGGWAIRFGRRRIFNVVDGWKLRRRCRRGRRTVVATSSSSPPSTAFVLVHID